MGLEPERFLHIILVGTVGVANTFAHEQLGMGYCDHAPREDSAV